jgi:hypothetical protein
MDDAKVGISTHKFPLIPIKLPLAQLLSYPGVYFLQAASNP